MATEPTAISSFENVWEDAYGRLKQEQPELLRDYEDGILDETRAKCRDSRAKQLQPLKSNTNPARLLQQLQLVLQIQSEYIEERQWSLHIGRKEVKMRDAVRRIVKAIDATKGVIATAVSSDPHAALAWAGVSCLLVLIINSSTQDDDAIEGLDYVQDMLSRYRVVQKVLMENKVLTQAGFEDADVRRRLRARVVDMYLQTLVYQFALIKQYSHSKATRVFRNVVGRDNWKQKLADVKSTEQECEAHRKVLETESQALISQRLVDHGEKLDQLLDTTKDQSARQTALDERANMEKWLSAMYPTDMDDLHTLLRNQVPTKLRGVTGRWFVDQIKGWLEDDKGMVYWGRGDPGVGKSNLMSEAVESLGHTLPQSNFDGYAFIYLQWDKQNQQTPTAVLSNILAKLWPGSRRLTNDLLKLQSKSRETHLLPSATDLHSTLASHGRPDPDSKDEHEKTQARFLLLIDGLDEATAETRATLIDCINALSQRHFRVVITSRKDLGVTTAAGHTTEFAIQAASKDLELFVFAELGQIKPELTRPIFTEHPQLREELTREIASRADGMFLLVKHHTQYVEPRDQQSTVQYSLKLLLLEQRPEKLADLS